eukprot:scaffold8296_cov305-Pinguiococcus_pyrenoidosus.AAC.4
MRNGGAQRISLQWRPAKILAISARTGHRIPASHVPAACRLDERKNSLDHEALPGPYYATMGE